MTAVNERREPAAADLGDLLDAGDAAFVTLEAGQTRLAAHAAVLAARSPVFAAMFQHDMLEAACGRVSIADVEAPVMRQLLAYMYTLQTPQLASTAPQLLAAADKYGLTALKAACERQMAAQLDVENAAAAAVVAVRHSCPQLTAAAVAFINANRQVLSTRGWAEAMRNHLEHVIEVTRLLSESPAETRTAGSGDTAAAVRHGRWGRTPVAAVAPTVLPLNSGPPDDADASRMRPPSAGDKKKAAPTHPQSKHSRTPAGAAAPVAAPPSAPSDAADVCRTPPPSAGDKKKAAPTHPQSKHSRTPAGAAAPVAAPPSAPSDAAVACRTPTPAAPDSKTAATTPPHTKHDQTRVAAVAPTAPQPPPPYDDAVASRMRPPAAGDKKETAATHTQSKHSRTAAAAAAPVAAPPYSPSDAAVACLTPRPASGDSRTATTTITTTSSTTSTTITTTSTISLPHGDRGDPCPTAAAAAPPTTPRSTPPVDGDAVSRLRRLSGEEKGRRLIEAAKVGAVSDVQTLLAAGADLEVRDSDGYTALHWAAERGHVDVARCLLEGGAEVDATNDSRTTPLHRAAQSGHAAVVRLLAASSARTDARNRWGWTPLHWAAVRGHAEAAAALLEAGADREATTDELYTPLDFARHKHYQHLISMLR
ncbi:cortactin-binding protein 2-like isoform X8 [Schistocerca nitens]|uniref:cortactin-binding protein 2-like isoform X8 n=1 Tax=Schistocerca nitens TaxID=7011 RepID=UPI002118B15D|nr:cortactin-binding protein 2-like isoform X8 [Schistocerca nitens]